MDIFKLTFQLGVFFAIYTFIWFFFDIGIKFITSGTLKSQFANYVVKFLKYIILVNVIFLFSIEGDDKTISIESLVPVVFILMLYFIGKFQQNQNTNVLFSRIGIHAQKQQFNPRYEITLICLSFLAFSFFIFFPIIADNPIAFWFKESIIDIESTPIIGFIFKIIGFFFLLDILSKTINSFKYIIVKLTSTSQNTGRNQFDDFEEVE